MLVPARLVNFYYFLDEVFLIKNGVIKWYFQTKLVGKVFTADEIGAGTDAKVTIWFTDIKGQCVGPLKIAEVGGDTMEQGQINNIT